MIPLPVRLVFLDTETHDIENPRLVQLAYIERNSEGGPITKTFSKTCCPAFPITIEAMAVHHITNRMVEDLPPFNVSELSEFLKSDPDTVVVAHNAKFDLSVLKNEGLDFVPKHIDTLRVSRHVNDIPRHSLQYLRYWMDIDAEVTAHDALGDVIVLDLVFHELVKSVQEKYEGVVSFDDAVRKMEELTRTPVLLKNMAFGKHVGKTFEEIASFDKPYLSWLLGAKTKDGAKEEDEDIIHTLKHFLTK